MAPCGRNCRVAGNVIIIICDKRTYTFIIIIYSETNNVGWQQEKRNKIKSQQTAKQLNHISLNETIQ